MRRKDAERGEGLVKYLNVTNEFSRNFLSFHKNITLMKFQYMNDGKTSKCDRNLNQIARDARHSTEQRPRINMFERVSQLHKNFFVKVNSDRQFAATYFVGLRTEMYRG